jgi:hypothetical protein
VASFQAPPTCAAPECTTPPVRSPSFPMPRIKLPEHQLAPATRTSYEAFRNVRLSPRVKNAVRLYATGAVKTKKEASHLAGLHPATLGMYMQHNTELQAMLQQIDTEVEAKVADTAPVLKHLEVVALAVMNNLMRNGGSEAVKLKAAQDILDRGPRMGKVQRTMSVGLTIDGEDAKRLAESLVASRNVTQKYIGEVQGDFEKVSTDREVKPDAK